MIFSPAVICLTHLGGIPDEKREKRKIQSTMQGILILHWNCTVYGGMIYLLISFGDGGACQIPDFLLY